MKIRIEGCPVADGKSPCHGCGGNWPGTKATSEQLTRAATNGVLLPDRLGCGLLAEGASSALREAGQNGILFEIPRHADVEQAEISK